MASVRAKNTAPELLLRRALHGRGFRYRTHVTTLPGKPDIVLPRYRATVLVHGCFWHGHDCPLFRLPATRREFWHAKIRRNQQRDAQVHEALLIAGWRCLTVWECALRGAQKLEFGQFIDHVSEWIKSSETTREIRGSNS